MPATFALSWNRTPAQAELLSKKPGRVISNYPSTKYDDVAKAAAHINSLDPEMGCQVEIFT
jgi:hypothetical protein